MNQELEALITAYDAVKESNLAQRAVRQAIYADRLDEFLQSHPNLNKHTFEMAILMAHRQWAAKQASQPSTLPPKA